MDGGLLEELKKKTIAFLNGSPRFNRRKADALIIFETEDKNRPTRGINFGAWFLFYTLSPQKPEHTKRGRALYIHRVMYIK